LLFTFYLKWTFSKPCDINGRYLTVDCLSPYIRQWCRQDPCRPGGTLGPRGSDGPTNIQNTNIFLGCFGLDSILMTDPNPLRKISEEVRQQSNAAPIITFGPLPNRLSSLQILGNV